MSTILDTIAGYARIRVARDKEENSLDVLRALCQDMGRGHGDRFYGALKKPGMSFICEVKKASPSKGVISPSFPYLDIAREYQAAGADCISCLTEPQFFQGSDAYLQAVRQRVELPLLRKDFTLDEYQIYEAKCIGADAVLLICSLLSAAQLGEYLAQAQELGLSALVEAHTAGEVQQALAAGAEIIGVNNRNLKDFSVNPVNSLRLRDAIPASKIFVAESGIKCAADTQALKQAGVQAVLVGEALMRSADAAAMLKEMRDA